MKLHFINNFPQGAAVSAKTRCNEGHEEEWESSHSIGNGRESVPYINVLLMVYLFLTGLHFDQLKVRHYFINNFP